MKSKHTTSLSSCACCRCVIDTSDWSGGVVTCPVCKAQLKLSPLDEGTGLPSVTTTELTEQDSSLVHAYGASGSLAPTIRSTEQGEKEIVCVRCKSAAAVNADCCPKCAMPFSTERLIGNDRPVRRMTMTAVVFGVLGIVVSSLSLYGAVFAAIGLGCARVARQRHDFLRGHSSQGRKVLGGEVLGALGLALACFRALEWLN